MSKLLQRLLIFFIGIPAVLLVVLISNYNHILMHLALLVVIIISINELYGILQTKGKLHHKFFLLGLCILQLIISYLSSLLCFSDEYIYLVFVLSCLLILSKEVFFPIDKDYINFNNSIYTIISSIFIIFYLGLLPTFISRIASLSNSIFYLCLYFLMTFICDSFAWLFGMLFGKNNRGYIKVSPNKSIIGFLGGIFGSVLIAIFIQYFYPQILPGKIIKVIIFGISVSISAIIGDLVESLLKRSANCKDSGNVVMGRGGLLDSIDSLLFVAPVFYIFVKLFFI